MLGESCAVRGGVGRVVFLSFFFFLRFLYFSVLFKKKVKMMFCMVYVCVYYQKINLYKKKDKHIQYCTVG